jgi:mannose-6-phosphate isomerase-like protein (cupin superfamily)
MNTMDTKSIELDAPLKIDVPCYIVMTEGEVLLEKSKRLQSGDVAYLDRSSTLIPEGRACIDLFFLPDETNLGTKIDKGSYGVYELVNRGVWSVALIEIVDSPKHFHRIEKEHFIVMSGRLAIEVNGKEQILEEGQSITLYPGMVHQLKTASEKLLRVLCFSFPAFDPADMHLIEI